MTPGLQASDELPEGMSWRPLDASDLDWLAHLGRDGERVAVAVTVRIRRASDGVERDYIEEWYPFRLGEYENVGDLISSIRFQWLEGNFSCDCNRSTFFARAVGEPKPEERPCGDGAFAVVAPAWLTDAP